MVAEVALVGSLPNPIGGVSTYILRCLNCFENYFYDEVIDPYASEYKVNIPITHHVTKYKGILKWLWLSYMVSTSKSRVIHFNFSSARSLIIALISFKGSKKWVVTLHNGNLNVKSRFYRLVIQFAVSRMDNVLYISDKQKFFYQSLLGKKTVDKLINLDSYLPPPLTYIDTKLPTDFSVFSSKFNHLGLANGYAKNIYCFDFLIKFAKENPDIGIILVVYGDSFDLETSELLAYAAEELKNVLIMSSVNPDVFLAMLNTVDIYLRPNYVDSFGIACADAILFGKKVVASDVCNRFQGCTLFEAGNYRDFEKKVKNAFYSNSPLISSINKCDLIETKKAIYSHIYNI